jgi:hypothetical protein
MGNVILGVYIRIHRFELGCMPVCFCIQPCAPSCTFLWLDTGITLRISFQGQNVLAECRLGFQGPHKPALYADPTPMQDSRARDKLSSGLASRHLDVEDGDSSTLHRAVLQRVGPNLPSEEHPKPMIGRSNLVPQPQIATTDVHSISDRAQSSDQLQYNSLSRSVDSKSRCGFLFRNCGTCQFIDSSLPTICIVVNS